jgi:hypothetical protein
MIHRIDTSVAALLLTASPPVFAASNGPSTVPAMNTTTTYQTVRVDGLDIF